MKSSAIELHRPGLLDAIKDIEAMGLWECLRGSRKPMNAAELVRQTSRDLSTVHAALDRLARAGLVTMKKARGRRRTAAYEVAMREISIVIDASDPLQRRIVNEVASYINREMSESLFKARRPIGTTGPNTWNFHHCSPLTLDAEDLTELKRRIARVEEFVRLLGDKHAGKRVAGPVRCNHGLVIRIEPLVEHVLPQPHVEFVSTTTVRERGTIRGVAHQSLTARERQVAQALRDGNSRAQVAQRLGIAEHTVGTLCKRIYRKLGIRRAAQLHSFDLA
ncbi:MAG: helix-turn-helix transcriptional regulator [Planctomycetaceae bacterium]|jgi:DNA-binding CsgD family transcriptional regulator/predicted transcriptional regulator|nr:helix-turn-helix transcriptional regulator [Planctomycetaceae bacterium]